MCRFVLAVALVSALCLSIHAQSPDPVEVNEPDVEWEPFALAGPGGPAVSFFFEGITSTYFGTGTGAVPPVGPNNSFFGAYAGQYTSEGYDNSFFGSQAGNANTTGFGNSFFGSSAGIKNTTGFGNSFFGMRAGFENTAGSTNSFFGGEAGFANTIGDFNSFFGSGTGHANTIGIANSFFGAATGYNNTAGSTNSFFGGGAGFASTVENDNTFIGSNADLDPGSNPLTNPVSNATAIGCRAYVAQSNSLVLGSIPGVNGGYSYVNVGIGTTAPARQLHLAGPNAVFRMDRSTDTAAFIMHRMDASGNPLKTFVVGTNASGANQGEFIINDVGTAVGGLGFRRMTITNEGNVQFTGNVSALAFSQTSSLAFKTNVRTYENALETVNRLRGVRFDWKDSGMPAVGLIAEEVDEVLPEVVAHDGGKATGVNYANLVAVLVEAVKEQQRTIQEQQKTIQHERTTNAAQQAELDSLKAKVAKLEVLQGK